MSRLHLPRCWERKDAEERAELRCELAEKKEAVPVQPRVRADSRDKRQDVAMKRTEKQSFTGQWDIVGKPLGQIFPLLLTIEIRYPPVEISLSALFRLML